MSWQDKIRNPDCTLCPLHESAEFVCLMGTGKRKADIMIVGEAPGAREDEEHAAFVGPAGAFLTELLEKIGISREECYITNAVKCRPPNNVTPSPGEIKVCTATYLTREIDAVRPSLILALGNSALRALTGRSGITKYRGKIFPLGSDIRVFPTFHPAAALRNPRYGPSIEADFSAFARLRSGTESSTLHTRTRLIRSLPQLKSLVRGLASVPEIAFDLETTGLHEWAHDAKIVTIGLCWGIGEAAVIPISHFSMKDVTDWESHSLRFLKPLFERDDCKFIAHNGKFDCKWLARFGIFVPLNFDTMLAAHVLEENRSKGLKPLSQLLLGAGDYNIEIKDCYNEPIKRLAVYNAKDCDYTLRLYYIFREQLRREPRIARVFKFLMMPASDVFTRVEAGGIWVDKDRLEERTREARDVVEKLEAYMGAGINYNSPQQVAKWLFQDLKLPVVERTPKDAPSTKESVLLQLAKQNKRVRALLKYRKWAKFLSTYLLPWAEAADPHSRIHPSYRLSGPVTGRLSSADPNIQQVPRDNFIRGIVGAPPGWLFVEADYSQVELRIAAMIAREHTMLRAFHEGIDIHLKTACETTGKLPADISKEERKKAKAINFGFLYGMGAARFVTYARDDYDVDVTLQEAEAVRDRFFDTYPNLRPWHARQRRLAERYQRVQSPIGRVRHLPDMRSTDKEVRAEAERQAINSPVQALASDLMLLSTVRLDKALSSRVARIVGSVHDSILLEVREDSVDEVVETVRATMEDVTHIKKLFGAEITVPIEVEIKAGTHWSEGEEIPSK